MAKPDVTTLPIFASEDTPELGATIRPTDEMQKFGIPSGGVWGREFLNWQFKSIGEWLEWVNNFALDSDKNLSDVNAIQAKINLGLDRVQNVADKDKVASDATKALIANLSGVTDAAAARSRLGLTSTAITMLTQSIRDITLGRVLKVGDFGIGMATYLGDSTNLNSLNTPSHVGKYYQDTNANTSTALGYPELAAGSLEVSEAAGVVQTYTVYASGNVWTRGFYNGSWSVWQKVVRTSDLSASTNNTSTTVPASVAGVKLAYDRATVGIIDASNAQYTANAAYNLAASKGTTGYFGSNGYVKLDSGLIIQWGVNNALSTVTLPIAFPNSMLQAVVAQYGNDHALYESPTSYNYSTTSFFIQFARKTNYYPITWIAIGY